MLPQTQVRGDAAPTESRFDLVLLVAVLAMLGLGLVMVYSSSAVLASAKMGDSAYFLKRQLAAAGVGLAAMILVLKVGYRRFSRWVYPILIVVGLLMIAVLIPGIGSAAGGARRWIRLPGFSLQPAELSKLALIIYLSYSLAKKREKVRFFSIGFLPHCIVTGVLAGFSLLEPDFGTAVILVLLLFTLLFTAGTKVSYLVLSVLLALPIGYHLISSSPYRMKRVAAFLDPWSTRRGAGYQIAESLMSIGSGGITGLGLGDGRQKLFFLPEAHTDFIFSIIGEELGLIGVVLLLGLIGIIIWRGIRAAYNASEAFGVYLAMGSTVLLGVQALTNIAVAMGLLPTKGLTLPLVSYGGSSVVISLIAAGLLLSVGQSRGSFLRPQQGGQR